MLSIRGGFGGGNAVVDEGGGSRRRRHLGDRDLGCEVVSSVLPGTGEDEDPTAESDVVELELPLSSLPEPLSGSARSSSEDRLKAGEDFRSSQGTPECRSPGTFAVRSVVVAVVVAVVVSPEETTGSPWRWLFCLGLPFLAGGRSGGPGVDAETSFDKGRCTRMVTVGPPDLDAGLGAKDGRGIRTPGSTGTPFGGAFGGEALGGDAASDEGSLAPRLGCSAPELSILIGMAFRSLKRLRSAWTLAAFDSEVIFGPGWLACLSRSSSQERYRLLTVQMTRKFLSVSTHSTHRVITSPYRA